MRHSAIYTEMASLTQLIMGTEISKAAYQDAYVRRFDSYGEFIELLESETRANKGYSKSIAHDSDKQFRGTYSWNEYISLAHSGWSQGRERIESMVKAIESHETFAGIREDWLFDVAGHSLDIARYCAGEPEQWATPVESVVEGLSNKIITLYLHIGALFAVRQEAMFARAAMVAALASILENCGFRVAIKALTCSSHAAGDGKTIITYTTLKQAEQPIDLERLAIALHPSTFRRGMFMLYDIVSGGPHKATYGFGQTNKHPAITDEPGAILINSDEGYFATDAERIEWLKAKLPDISKPLADRAILA